jgi:catechol 2,3-dioxygenase-like lactoylglutathione lyase family enzyme
VKFEARLGVHGVVIRVEDLAAAERAFRKALGIPVLRRTRREVVLGDGPELFITLRRAAGVRSTVLEEIHVAVRGLETRAAGSDALGGVAVLRRVSGSSLWVREFRSEPSPSWRKPGRRSRRQRRRSR